MPIKMAVTAAHLILWKIHSNFSEITFNYFKIKSLKAHNLTNNVCKFNIEGPNAEYNCINDISTWLIWSIDTKLDGYNIR